VTFDEIPQMAYQPKGEPDSPELRERYWKTAIGLQEVDGLEVSSYLRDVAAAHVEGTYTLRETRELLWNHYDVMQVDGSTSASGLDRAKEADLVSQRIVEVLSAGGFMLAPLMLSHIHATLFQDLDPAVYHPGEFKVEQVIKPEAVLNGDSVFYAPPTMYTGMLDALFAREATHDYAFNLTDEDVANFTRFIARVWQVHPFYEGNTRTVAVFAVLYLRELGCVVGNDPFERHAAYFRDALVRANYRNRPVGVDYDFSYLERFMGHLALGSSESPLFDRHELICQPMFDHPEALKYATVQDAAEVRGYLARAGFGR